jgi:hypothetical protein
MKQRVTYTELKDRRRCPYRAHLSYDKRLAPIVKSPGFREGNIMDAGLNALYDNYRRTGTHDLNVMLAAIDCMADKEEARIAAGATLFEEEWQAIRDKTTLLRDVAGLYVPWAREQDAGLQVISRQFQADVPVVAPSGRASTKYQFRFKPDGIVAMDGELWLWEDKAWKIIDRPSLKLLTIDEQCGMYLWGLRQLIDRGKASKAIMEAFGQYGYPAGVIYNILRKKTPTVPKLLAKGGTSQDKAIDTTHEVYLATLLERGQDPADYAEILDLLKEKGNTFFVRQPVYRNASELAEIGRRIWEVTQTLSESRAYKCVDRTCAQCAFFPLCVEYSDELLLNGYRVKDTKHEEYSEEEELAA